MVSIRLFVTMVAVVLLLALLAAVLWPLVGLADGAGPAVGTYVEAGAGAVKPGRIAGQAGVPFQGTIGPAPVLLAECEALPCLFEMTIDGKPGYMIVSPVLPRG